LEKVVIRKATLDDIPSIVQACLTSALQEETKGFAAPEWVTYSVPEELRKVWTTGNRLREGSEVVVAEKDGKVVGFIVFSLERDYAYIDDIDITKNEQRKGIGKALVAYVEKVARANGYRCVKTDTTENVEGVSWKSYGFWTKMGFKNTGERLPTKWGFNMILFAKKLE
jgi:N-acetylglutamate synthase-like GNAT family acetyltransferase